LDLMRFIWEKVLSTAAYITEWQSQDWQCKFPNHTEIMLATCISVMLLQLTAQKSAHVIQN